MASSYTYTTKHINEIQKLFGQDILFVDLCGLFSSKATSLTENDEIQNLRNSIVMKTKSYDGTAKSQEELDSLLLQFKNTATRVATSPNDHHYHTATKNLTKTLDNVLEQIGFDSNYHDFIQSQNQIDRSTMPVTKLIALRALTRRKLFLSEAESLTPFEYKQYEISALEAAASRSLEPSVVEFSKEIEALSKDPKNDTYLDAKLANMTYESLYDNLFEHYNNFLNCQTLHVHKSISVLGDVANQHRNTALAAVGVGTGLMLLQSISAGPMLPFLPGGSWEASWAFIAQQLPWYLLGGSAAGITGSLIYYNATNGSSKKLINNMINTNSLQKAKILELAKAYKEKKIKLDDILKDKEIAHILGKNKMQQRRALSRLALANDRAEAIIKLPISSLQRTNYKLQQDAKLIDKDNKVSIKTVDSKTKENAIEHLFESCSKTNPFLVQMGVVAPAKVDQQDTKRKVIVKKTTSAKSTAANKKVSRTVVVKPAFARVEERISSSKVSFEGSKEEFKETLKNKHLTSTNTTFNIDGQEIKVNITKNQFAVSSQMFTSIMKDIQAYAKSSNNGESNFNYSQTTNKKNTVQVTVSKNKK